VTYQFSEFALWPLRDVAAPQQTHLHALSYPLRVFHIGLAARYRFDVLGIDHDRPQASVFEDVVDGLPVNPRTLHCQVDHTLTLKPIGKLLQFCREGGKALYLLPFRRQDASNDTLLVDIQSRTALKDDLHGPLLLAGDRATL
jgi:hypothetical protein